LGDVRAAPQRRTQAERRASSEAALLKAAAELIAERGVERASLRSIGARAGISRAMPAYHFGSKDALIARLAERGHERTMAATAAALQRRGDQPEAMTALEVLCATIETFLAVLAAPDAPEERAVVVMWGAAFPSEASLSAMADSDRETHGHLAGLIRTGQADGSMRTDLDPDDAATVVMGLARGIAGLSLNDPPMADTPTVRRLCGDTIRALLAPDRPPPDHAQ
jgi:AcrR family transcriptional regulator